KTLFHLRPDGENTQRAIACWLDIARKRALAEEGPAPQASTSERRSSAACLGHRLAGAVLVWRLPRPADSVLRRAIRRSSVDHRASKLSCCGCVRGHGNFTAATILHRWRTVCHRRLTLPCPASRSDAHT